MLRAAAIALLLFSFSCTPGARLDSLFEQARTDLWAGDLGKALSESDRGIALASERRDQVYQWKFRLLRCETLLNSSRAEEVLRQLVGPDDPPQPQLVARKRMLEGQARSIVGPTGGYDNLLEEAHRIAEAAKAEDVLADVENIQGSTLIFRGRFDEADKVLRSALARARTLRSPYTEAGVLMNLGRIPMEKNRYDEAAGFFEQAAQASGPRFQLLYSVVQVNLAACYSNLGEFDRAIRIQLDNVARHERTGARFYLPGSLGAVGELYLKKGDYKNAIPYLQHALSIASEMSRTPAAAQWAATLSLVYIESGDWDNAETLNAEAIRLKKSIHSDTLYYNDLNAAAIAAGRGQLEEAVRLYTRALAAGKDDPAVVWEAHGGLGAIEQKRHQPAAAGREYDAAIGQLEQTRSALQRTEFKLPFLERSIRLYQQYVEALLAQGQVDRALSVADSSRAQVLADRSGLEGVRRLEPGAFTNLARQSGSVLLSYWLTPTQSHVWVVTPREIRHVALPPADQIEPLVAQYKDAIEHQLADPIRTRLPVGEKLYQILIEPVRPLLPAGTRVVVVPDGVLHGLNLEALPIPGETPRYWAQDVTLEVAPSLAMWGAARRPATNRRLLLLGDALSSDPAFPPLAQAEREIASITKNFIETDRVVLTRESASPQAYLAAAAGPFAAIHFTAHAVANGENPLESAVLLSGGKLYARDVMDLKLNADLVTFSTCRGAGLRTYSGEGLVGFAWAFLRAGARHVIAGLWDVNDQSTAGLMDVLYRELAAGKRPAEALRTAKLAMIESRGNLRKPYYWAPFQLYTVAP
jgi:CHAT domain-containing protein/Tfp pilus assembly protein PilF